MTEPASRNLDFLTGGGAMGAVIREMDWSETPLGPLSQWPQSLRTTVSLALSSTFPISIAWGRDHTQIYNDGYWPICGAKHPTAMGQNFRECWASAFPVIGDAFESALAGRAQYLENQRMFLDRHGYLEETFFTFSFSPIRDETGSVGGLFHPVTEQTPTMLAERRVRALRDLAGRSETESVDAACAHAVEVLAEHHLDLPFVALYRLDATAGVARLVAATGCPPESPLTPAEVRLDDLGSWPFAAVLADGARLIEDLADRFGSFDCGPYEEPPHSARIQPLRLAGVDGPFGFLVAGSSPRLPMNAAYENFFELLGGSVATIVSNARAYQEERRRAEALAELDRAKTAFFSNVSHEFRTPLTLILGPTEDAVAREGGALRGEGLDTVHRNALRLLKLVNSLLDFSRIEAGRVRAVFQPTDMAALTEDLASGFRAAIERAGLELKIEAEPCDEPVYLDSELYEKILLNLLSNAFKFTFEGEIAVRVWRDRTAFHLEVRDTGVGIPADEIGNLFKRFHRIEGTRSRTHEGSGIGLALVDELVAMHGGEVEVESEVGVGSSFVVSFPLGSDHLPSAQVGGERQLVSTATGAAPYVEEALRWLPDDEPLDASPDDAPSDPEPPPAPRPPLLTPTEDGAAERSTVDTRRARVLIADDNADMRHYLARLVGEHWDVVAVPDGRAALEAARRRRPDLILTDVMMPVMDGAQLVAELRSDPQTAGVPVIIVSARAGDEARVEGLNLGADDYLVKPFSARELVARIATHLKIASLRSDAERARQRLSELFLQAPVPIAVFEGPEHRVVLANDGVRALLAGREPSVGRPLVESVPELAGQPLLAAYDRVYATGEPFVADELRVDLADARGIARPRYFTVVAHPTRDSEGDVEGVMVVGYDVSAQRQMAAALREHEARLRSAVEAGSVATFSWDLSTDRVTGETRLAEFFELPAAEVETGAVSMSQVLDAVHPDDRSRFEDLLERTVSSHRELVAEMRVARAGTAARWLLARGRAETGADGEMRVVGAVVDVSEQKEIEHALHRANRAKDEFLAMLGHELRNPLSPIVTAIHLLRLRGAQGFQRELDIIERQVRHLSGLVEDLLDVSRIARGRVQLDRRPVEIAEVVGRALEMASPLLEQHSHQLSLSVPAAGLAVMGDPARLAQVVANLLTNAAKYTPREGRIEVSAKRDGDLVELQVRDNGIGIQSDMLPRIFDSFVQEHQTLDRSLGGLGLGLTIVKNLVESHDGTVEARSDGPGRGSTFLVRLPRSEAEAPLAVEDVAEPSPGAEDRALRVLIVDDNEDAATLVSSFTELLGFESSVCYDGPSALEEAANFRPHVALLDIGLPVMDGYELAARFREHPDLAEIRLVAITGYGQPSDRQRSEEAGFVSHLVKPLDSERLRELLEGIESEITASADRSAGDQESGAEA